MVPYASSIETELAVEVLLGAEIELQRPPARSEDGSAWIVLSSDTRIAIASEHSCSLRLRLVARDDTGEPLASPAWVVSVATRLDEGPWDLLTNQSVSTGEFTTDDLPVSDLPRVYRLTIGLFGTGEAVIRELVVARHQEQADADDPVDVVYDTGVDLIPAATPAAPPPPPGVATTTTTH